MENVDALRDNATATPNGLARLRSSTGLSQRELADLVCRLGGRQATVTANTVSRWERGVVLPTPFYRRLLAQALDVSVDDLGLPARRGPTDDALSTDDSGHDPDVDRRVRQSWQEWARVRRLLNTQRRGLSSTAASVYPPENRLGDTGLVAHPEWLPDEPVDIRAIQLHHQPAAADLAVDGTEPETDHVRPRTSLVRRYARYTQAIRDLAPPRLFENRVCWRLLGLSWAGPTPELRFTDTTYFAAVDVSEAASHELALVALDGGGESTGRPLALRDLPFRRAIGDPFDLTRRPVMTAISTLTIRRDGPTASFLLHRRNARSVAIAGGMLQVIPSGIFQPSSVLPAAAAADFDLWRNIMREYSEELLGNADHDGDGRPVRYDREPFRTMAAALADGSLRVHCLGIALDALSLVGEIMTVAVWDAARYDALAGDFVEHNDEGALVGEQMSFDEATVTDLLRSRRLAPAGSGCLHLAWQFRDGLLRRT